MFLLAFVGFGFLIPIFPLHTWSPDGHVAAPTAVSMLHAGVLLKLGAYGLLRLGLDLFPHGWSDWALLICIIGVINIVYGAFCAMNQTDLKYVIGYSSVSHMGYVLLGIGIGNQASLTGAGFQMFAHGIMTALFFALIGYVYEKSHTRQIAEHLRADAAHAARRRVLRDRGRVEHGPALDRRLRRRAARLRRRRPEVGLARCRRVRRRGRHRGLPAAACSPRSCSASRARRSPSIDDAPPLRFAPMAILAFIIMVVGLFPGSMYQTITSGVMPLLEKLAGG